MQRPLEDKPTPPLLRFGMLEAGLLFGIGFWIDGAIIGGLTGLLVIRIVSGH